MKGDLLCFTIQKTFIIKINIMLDNPLYIDITNFGHVETIY